ncbi:MAG: chemotaxis response regulator protein-glutamate methylesterase [Cellulosilyticaceae bacterium]
MNKKIRVLIVDDSLVFREVLARGLSADKDIEVVAKATDPFDARDKILQFHPDVMTCDVNMPKMDGIEFIRKLLPQYSIPVIVISGLTERVFDAINAGAVDFVAKPDVRRSAEVQQFILNVNDTVKVASKYKVVQAVLAPPFPNPIRYEGNIDMDRIIAIGASTGGTEAITRILKNLPSNIPGIVIVQHIPPDFSKMFAQRLDKQTGFNVREAINGDFVETGKVLIAPGDKHMRIKKVGNRYKVEVFEGEKVNGHCPSVDVLFESVAKECQEKAVGIILTGMGYDGAKGLLAMKRKGAKTIGQDESSCIVYGMPKVAYEVGAVEVQAALDNIPKTIYNTLNKN